MPMKYSCFISYAHGQGKHVGPLIHALHEEISSQLEMCCEGKVFLDEERLRPGYEYNEQLAQAICESACMVVAYTPIYAKRDYCRREFEAMRLLEEKRKQLLGKKFKGYRLFIPVVLNGAIDCLPTQLKSTTHSCDITEYTLRSNRVRHCSGFSLKLKAVCDGIAEIHDLLSGYQGEFDNQLDCADFYLPLVDSVAPWEDLRTASFPGRVGTP